MKSRNDNERGWQALIFGQGLLRRAGSAAAVAICLSTLSARGQAPVETGIDLTVVSAAGRVKASIGVYRNGLKVAEGYSDPERFGRFSTPKLDPGVYELRIGASERNGRAFAPQEIFGVIVEASGRTKREVVVNPGVALEVVGSSTAADVPMSDYGRDLAQSPSRNGARPHFGLWGRIDVVTADSLGRPLAADVGIFADGQPVAFHDRRSNKPPERLSGTSDPSMGGLISFPLVEPGEYEIRVKRCWRDGVSYAPQDIFKITVAGGQRTVVRANPSRGETVQFSGLRLQEGLQASRLDLWITNSEGLPVKAQVAIFKNGQLVPGMSNTSDPEFGGMASFVGLKPDWYEVRVGGSERDGRKLAPQDIFQFAFPTGNRCSVNIALNPGSSLEAISTPTPADIGTDKGRGRIDVIVRNASGTPTECWVEIVRGNRVAQPEEPHVGGLWVAPNLEAGVYQVNIRGRSTDGREMTKHISGVELVGGMQMVCDVDLEASADDSKLTAVGVGDSQVGGVLGSLQLAVQDGSGKPVSTWFGLYRSGELVLEGLSGPVSGLSTMRGLAPGMYEVRFRKAKGELLQRVPGIVVSSGRESVCRVVLKAEVSR